MAYDAIASRFYAVQCRVTPDQCAEGDSIHDNRGMVQELSEQSPSSLPAEAVGPATATSVY